MKKKKEFIVTDKMQKVAVDILSELEAYMMSTQDYPDEIMQIYDKMYDKYELCDDPFTGTCCTLKECAKNSLKMQRQIMIERYGHCDGLE